VLVLRRFAARSRRFVAAQMKIDKNGKIGRKQLRDRRDLARPYLFPLNKQGASVAGFFGGNRRLLPSTR